MTDPEKSTFHTDQNRWENRDFEPEKKSRYEEYQDALNDSEENASLLGRPAGEYDEGLELNYHEDDYHKETLSRIHADEEIERAVKELLHNSKKLDAADITVTVDNCNVTLSGSVRSQEERDYATEVVKLVHGVGDVHCNIIVSLNPGILPSSIGRNP